MIYKVNWDEENERFGVISYERNENDVKSNLVGQNDGIFSSHLENGQIANLLCMSANTILAEGSMSVVRCRDCGLYFTVAKESIAEKSTLE